MIDEVVICLPFSQWDKVDAISQICEDEGKIVRVPMDVIGRAFSEGRMEELDGTPVYSLVSGPDRVFALALKRGFDMAASSLALVILSLVFVGIAIAIRRSDGGPALPVLTLVALALGGSIAIAICWLAASHAPAE